MIDPVHIALLVLSGFAGGFIAGLLGIGGGIIYILIFSVFLKRLSAQSIESTDMVQLMISNSLFAIFFAGLSGSYRQWKSHNFYFKPVLVIGLSGIVSAIGIKEILTGMHIYSTHDFAIFFTLLMVPLLFRMFSQKQKVGKTDPEKLSTWKMIITGLISGAASALSGLGGGFILIPILNGYFRIPMKKTVSLSLGTIAVVALGYSLFNLFFTSYPQYAFPLSSGAIVLPMVLPVVLGVLIGTPIGVKVSHKLPALALKVLFAVFTLFVISKLLIEFL